VEEMGVNFALQREPECYVTMDNSFGTGE
jgi:hypothetical protein